MAKRWVRERIAVAAARTNQLVALETRRDVEWPELDGLVGSLTVKPTAYDDVVCRLEALRELAVMRGTEDAFRARLEVLLDRYESKAVFRRRILEASLTRAGEPAAGMHGRPGTADGSSRRRQRQ